MVGIVKGTLQSLSERESVVLFSKFVTESGIGKGSENAYPFCTLGLMMNWVARTMALTPAAVMFVTAGCTGVGLAVGVKKAYNGF